MVPNLNALSYSKLVCSTARMNEEESERAFARHFILPGKVIRVEWLKSSSLDENINSKPQWPKQFPRQTINLKLFLSATRAPSPE